MGVAEYLAQLLRVGVVLARAFAPAIPRLGEVTMIKQAKLFIAGLTLSGCSAFVLPARQLESTEASIRSAEELGAAEVPKARVHLEMAKDQGVVAKKMAADGNDRAALVLERAQSDAELALSMAREASVHEDAVAAAAGLRAVRERGEQSTTSE